MEPHWAGVRRRSLRVFLINVGVFFLATLYKFVLHKLKGTIAPLIKIKLAPEIFSYSLALLGPMRTTLSNR